METKIEEPSKQFSKIIHKSSDLFSLLTLTDTDQFKTANIRNGSNVYENMST